MCQLISLSPPPTSSILECHFFKAVATEIWPVKGWFWSNTFYAKVYKSQRKTIPSRENLPSSVTPDGTDNRTLCTPAQQRDGFITVIYTCPKGAQSKLTWRFFSDSWDWNIPSVFNTERLHPLFSDESLSEYHCAIFSLWKTMLSHCFLSPASICKIAFRRMA